LSSEDVNQSAARALNTDEADVLGRRLAQERNWVRNSLDASGRWNEADQQYLQDVFGDSSPVAREHVTEVLNRMDALIGSYLPDNFRVDITSGIPAYVITNDPNTVYLGESFFDLTANHQTGVLVHEMSHFDLIGATDDIALGGAAALSRTLMLPPTQALGNAQSYSIHVGCATAGGSSCLR
jgi:hypothetical protein